MSYKILHFADLHLDMSFAGQGFPIEYGNERRLDLRAVFTRILAKAREFKVNAITIGGNLFVQPYLLPETADFIRQQLALLAPIQVVIAPGIQDPYTNESPYAHLNWPENVNIFHQGKLSHLELTSDIHLWGACYPPARGHKLLNGFQPAKGVNILLLHAIRECNNIEVHTISNEAIQKAGFRYALLGGDYGAEISESSQPLIIFPGSPEPLTPSDENHQHQVVVLEIDDESIGVQAFSLQQWHYVNVNVDLTNCTSNTEAARQVDEALDVTIAKAPHSAVTITLVGHPPAEFSIPSLRALIQSSAFYCLENHFELNYDLELLAHEQTVRGLLVRRFLDRVHNVTNDAERRQQTIALNFALQALEGKRVTLYDTKTA